LVNFPTIGAWLRDRASASLGVEFGDQRGCSLPNQRPDADNRAGTGREHQRNGPTGERPFQRRSHQRQRASLLRCRHELTLWSRNSGGACSAECDCGGVAVINSSPGNLVRFSNEYGQSNHSRCDAEIGVVLTYDSKGFWPVELRAHRLDLGGNARRFRTRAS